MKRVLVIDDSSSIRKAIRRILEPMGFEVHEACDGADALARVTAPASNFEVVLCDIDMPVMDGLTFLGQLRGMPAFAGLPVIMCTTHNTFEKIQQALSLGANEYIMKPFDADIMSAKLATVGIAA